jgi:hypothetical protein
MIASVDRFVAADLKVAADRRVSAGSGPSPCLRNAVLGSAVLWAVIAAAVVVAW